MGALRNCIQCIPVNPALLAFLANRRRPARSFGELELDSRLQGGPKIGTSFYASTLPNINRFPKLFHSQNQEKICNNTITKDPTTPQVYRYTTL